jgi:hypothetical protein
MPVRGAKCRAPSVASSVTQCPSARAPLGDAMAPEHERHAPELPWSRYPGRRPRDKENRLEMVLRLLTCRRVVSLVSKPS